MSAPTPSPELQQVTAIAKDVVQHVNAGVATDAALWDKHWHPDFESVEGDGQSWKGRAAVQGKCEWWMSAHHVYSTKATGPFVGPHSFAVHYEMDVEPKDKSWPRRIMHEVGVYTVKAGKVVREEFLYTPMH